MERTHQIVGYNSRGDREANDYYATPAATTRALLSVRVHVFKRRQALMKNGVASGAGMMTFAWFVWEAGHDGAPVVGWI
jgi:hypothetical protein